jgi:ubiquinone/menaquinone biosynthesis C-methylase UbiE
MLTLFPRIKANPIPPPQPVLEPVEQVSRAPQADLLVDSPVAAERSPEPYVAPLPASTSGSYPEPPAQSVVDVLAEVSLPKSAAQARPVPEQPVWSSPAAENTEQASAEPLDIGEWDAAAEPELVPAPVIGTKPETVFQAFSAAWHAHDPQPGAASPAAPEVNIAAAAQAEPVPQPQAPPIKTPEDILAKLACEVATEIAAGCDAVTGIGPVTLSAAVPQLVEKALPPVASPVDPAPRQALVSRDEPKGPKGSLFVLPRVPEPEAIDDSGEVEAYASAAAQSHLDAIDDTFVAHAQLLLKGRERGRALDIGTGPGQIVIKLGYQLTRWKFLGVDRSAAMIAKAQEAQATAPELAGRVDFVVADGNRLDLPGHSFDLVMCNSVLHHFADPQNLFAEMARLVKPGGAILLRDLLRPARLNFGHHARKHGKHYSGEMKRLYIASLHAAYTEEELQKMVAASPLQGVSVFCHRHTHIGFQRAMAAAPKRLV